MVEGVRNVRAEEVDLLSGERARLQVHHVADEVEQLGQDDALGLSDPLIDSGS